MKKPHRLSLGLISASLGLIIGGLTVLILPFFDLFGSGYKYLADFHSSLQLVWAISTLILIGYVVGAARMLRHEEFGRSLVVFLAIIDIPHLIVAKAIYNNLLIQPVYLRNFEMIPASIVINLLLVHFLHKPDVRKQFKV